MLCLAHSTFSQTQGISLVTAHRADWPFLVWEFLLTAWQGLEGTSGDGLVEIPCSKHGQGEQVAQTVPSQVLNSSKDGDFTILVGHLLHSLITFAVEVFSYV